MYLSTENSREIARELQMFDHQVEHINNIKNYINKAPLTIFLTESDPTTKTLMKLLDCIKLWIKEIGLYAITFLEPPKKGKTT